MKIKTVSRSFDWREDFDNAVNEALGKGWQLVKREVIPGSPNDSARLYAELVKLDPPAEPETPDPLDLLRQVRKACLQTPACHCNREGCPMFDWCEGLRKGGDPTDWVLPGEVRA